MTFSHYGAKLKSVIQFYYYKLLLAFIVSQKITACKPIAEQQGKEMML
nr:MAG TPA: hypothetical protein [Inoviridae sp.]